MRASTAGTWFRANVGRGVFTDSHRQLVSPAMGGGAKPCKGGGNAARCTVPPCTARASVQRAGSPMLAAWNPANHDSPAQEKTQCTHEGAETLETRPCSVGEVAAWATGGGVRPSVPVTSTCCTDPQASPTTALMSTYNVCKQPGGEWWAAMWAAQRRRQRAALDPSALVDPSLIDTPLPQPIRGPKPCWPPAAAAALLPCQDSAPAR